MTAHEHVDITSPKFKADPFAFYERLRSERPVASVRLPNKSPVWLVSRYADVVAALKDPRLVKNRRTVPGSRKEGIAWTPPIFEPLTRNMLDLDPPDHTRLRTLVHKAFTPRVVERMRERIAAVSERLLDEITPGTAFDLIERYALPIPTTIIAEILGVPASDRHRFHRWSNAIVTIDASPWSMVRAIPALYAFMKFIRRQVDARRADPGDDLLSALVATEEAGDRLSADELVAMVFLLLVAGHETTVNLIGNAVLTLLTHPDQMAWLRQNLSDIDMAVEELLRFAGPLATATERFTREDMDIAGTLVPADSVVYAVLASANRDERQFAESNTLCLDRRDNRARGIRPRYSFLCGRAVGAAGRADCDRRIAAACAGASACDTGRHDSVEARTCPSWHGGLPVTCVVIESEDGSNVHSRGNRRTRCRGTSVRAGPRDGTRRVFRSIGNAGTCG